MDRIGAIKEAYRLENRRVFLPAPVPFWRRVRLSLAAFGLLCFMSGYWVGNAHANLALDGKCYATTAEALEAYKSKFPIFDPVSGGWYTASAYLTNGNLLTSAITKNGAAFISVNATLASCTQLSNEAFDSALGGAFWAFGFSGVMILYFSSHVIGLVLKRVRNG